jgi:hypothetical protein
MKRFKLLAILLVLLPILAFSADVYRPTGYEAVTVDNTVGGVYLTVAKYFTVATSKIVADFAVVKIESAQIRYTVDTTAPTTSVGMLGLPMETLVLGSFEELKNFRAIRTGDTSASIKVTYYKYYDQR